MEQLEDQNNLEFNKQELKDFAKFWQSDVGQKYIKKLERARDGWLTSTFNCVTGEQAFKNANVAYGIAIVITDINLGIDESKKDKKEAPAKV